MAIGEIATTTDLNGWQHRAVGLLAGLVKDGLKAERYPLEWTITSSGHLLGTVSKLSPHSENDRRAVYDEWCRAVGAAAPSESELSNGGLLLTAAFQHPTSLGDVHGALTLDIDPTPDDEDGGRD